jgi:hypothetical protein
MKNIIPIVVMCVAMQSTFAQDTTKVKQHNYKGGISLYPMPNKPMLGYRSNMYKNWALDTKLGYTLTLIPQFNIELNLQHRHIKNEVFNVYSGIGFTLDGFTPGLIVPLGFEIKPFTNYPNIVIVTEASPKLTFSFTSAFNSSLNGTIGLIYFKPRN